MDKKGFIRTLEAVIAVIVVFVFIYSVGRAGYESGRDVENIRSLEESILSEISKNDEYRECIVTTSGDTNNNNIADIQEIEKGTFCPEIKIFIEESLPKRFVDKGKYRFNVCDPAPSEIKFCTLPDFGDAKEVFTSAVIITSSLENGGSYNPRILRMWLYY